MEIEMSDQDLCQCSILMLTNLRNLIHWEKSNHEQICTCAWIKKEVKSFQFQHLNQQTYIAEKLVTEASANVCEEQATYTYLEEVEWSGCVTCDVNFCSQC